MKCKLFVLAWVLLVSSAADAQRGSAGGKVIDGEGNPVGGVAIVFQPASDIQRPRKLETEDDGSFVLAGLTPGAYSVSYEKEGYEKTLLDVRVQIGQRARLGEIVLRKLPEDSIKPGAQEHFDAGVAAAKQEDYAKAVESFSRVLELAPNVPEVHYNLGLAYEKLEDADEAIKHYEKALETRPDYGDALVSLASIYTARKDWSRAAELLKRAAALRPDDLTTHYNLGAVSMNANDMDTARVAFGKVLEIDPHRAAAHFQLGMIALSQTRNDDAILHLEKYLELEPDGPHAATAKGIVASLKTP